MKTTMKTVLSIVCMFMIMKSKAATDVQWTMQTNPYDCKNAVIEADTIWVATTGGLCKYKTDGTLLKIYTSADGLSQTSINDIAIDSKGNKWLATTRLLSKFDGKTFTEIRPSGTSVSLNYSSVAVDKNDNVYFGNYFGYFKYSNGTVSTSSLSPNMMCPTLKADKNGLIWYINNSKSVSSFDGSTSTVYTNGMPKTFISLLSINVDNNNTPYVYGAANYKYKSGFIYYDGSTWVFDSLQKTTTACTFDANNNLITSYNDSIFTYNKGTLISKYKIGYNKTDWGAPVSVNYLIYANNSLWILTNSGLLKSDGTTIQKFLPSAVAPGKIYGIARDSSNVMWVTSEMEVSSFKNNQWTTYPYSTTKINGSIVAVDKNNVKWFVASGIVSYDNTTWTKYDKTNTSALTTDSWRCLAIDKSNNKKVFGSYDKGVFTFDGTTWTRLTTTGLPSLKINGIAVDKNSVIWVATDAGVAKYENSQWTAINTLATYSVFADSKGRIFTGHAAYVQMLSGTTWTSLNKYYTKQSLQNNISLGFGSVNIISFAEDANGKIWFGYSFGSTGGGYFNYDGTNVIDPDPDNVTYVDAPVYGICADNAKNVWIGALGCTLINDTASTSTPITTTLSVSPTSITMPTTNTATFNITTTGSWSITSSEDWIGFDNSTGTGSATVTFTAKPFTGTGTRTAIITVSSTLKSTGTTITVTQNGDGTTYITENALSQISISPNPAHSLIEIKSSSNIKSVQIFDEVGVLVQKAESTKILSIENLSHGIYFVNVVTENGESTISKLIIE